MNNNYENLPAVLNANQLATALGISRAGAYQLLNTATFPTLRIGKRLLVPRDRLVEWIEQNGYRMSALARECYIEGVWSGADEKDWLTEIQMPIEKA